ncbi:MAG: hypothetical protein V3V00_03990, partial [Saprospiraceae bacterium]
MANLKGFLNVVRAKFFFIGGREMYDAALADISDRDSFYSSIFNDVIYVESFFKDSTNTEGQGKGGVTQMTEAYLCNIIMHGINSTNKENKDKKNDPENLKSLFAKLNFNAYENKIKQTTEHSLLFGHKRSKGCIQKVELLKNEIAKAEADKKESLQIKIDIDQFLILEEKYKKLLNNQTLKSTTINEEAIKINCEIDSTRKKLLSHKYFKTLNKRDLDRVNLKKHSNYSTNREKRLTISIEQSKKKIGEYQNDKLSYDELKKQAYKVIFTLQNYIVYLTYRSNGTPKKLTALTEKLMVTGPSLKKENEHGDETNKEFFRDNVVVLHDKYNEKGELINPITADLSKKVFLKFGY